MEKLVIKLNFGKYLRSSNSKNTDNTTIKPKDPTGAKRQKTFRDKWKNNELMKQKNIDHCAKYMQSIKVKRKNNAKLDEQLRKQERERKAKYRKKLKEQKMALFDLKEQKEAENTSKPKTCKTCKHAKTKINTLQRAKSRLSNKSSKIEALPETPATVRKRAQRVREKLPNSPEKWASTVEHVLKNATPKKKKALNFMLKKKQPERNLKKRQFWRSTIGQFLHRDDISRQMPNKRDVLKVNGQAVAKRHLLCSQKEAYLKFLEIHPDYPFKYTTFRKSFPRHVKKLNLKHRRVCVCLKCFNVSEKIRAMNPLAVAFKLPPMTLRSTYKDSVCLHETEFPHIQCIEGSCEKCLNNLSSKYKELIKEKGDTYVKYTTWEKVHEKYLNSKNEVIDKQVWQQVEHKASLKDLFSAVQSEMKEFKSHIFRNDFQYFQHQKMIKTLPLDHAIVFADFSQNYALCPNDEIQAVHYVKKQITIHTMYLIRHSKNSTNEKPQLTKETIVMVSNDLKHSSSSVYNFTLKLLSYMRNNPEKIGLPTVLHRITDNCGFEYKCKDSFSHMSYFESLLGVKVIYHYSEPGHGKGPHDGIGATIKHGLDRLVVQDRVKLRNAYEVYLAASRNLSQVGRNADSTVQKDLEFSCRIVMYVPKSMTQRSPKDKVLPIKGTMQLRYIQCISDKKVEVGNLSCGCQKCIQGIGDSCQYKEWRKTSTHILRETEPSPDVNTNNQSTNTSTSCGDGNPLCQVLTESLACHQRHQHLNAVALESFKAQINIRGWQVRGSTPDDGNCCFWALSDQLDRMGLHVFTHKDLRRKAISFLREMPEIDKAEMANFLTTDLEVYTNNMEKDGTYADHIILVSLSKVFGRSIRIVHADRPDVLVGDNESGCLVLGYLPDIKHYVSLEPISYEPESYVAVVLESSRKIKHLYIAKVLESDGTDVKLKFMSQKNKYEFTWPNREDIHWQDISDIMMKLSSPAFAPGRGLKMIFRKNEIDSCFKTIEN